MSLARFHAFHAEQDALLAARGLLPTETEFTAAMTRTNEVEQWRERVDSIADVLQTRELFP